MQDTIDVSAVADLALIFLGQDVQQIRVRGDEYYHHVEIVICLREDTWAARERVIEDMVKLRQHLINEMTVEYSFGERAADDGLVDGPYVSTRELVKTRG